MALLVKNDGCMSSDGHNIPGHQPRVRFRPRELEVHCRPSWQWQGERAIWTLEGEDVRFLPYGNEPNPGIEVEGENYLMNLKNALGDAKKARIRRGCIGCNPKKECLIGGVPALSGRAILAGGTVRPVDIINEKTVSCKPREELWGFRSLCHPEIKSKFLGEVFNGIMFDMDIDDLDSFRLDIGGQQIPLFPESRETFILKDCSCSDEQEQRLVIWVENLPDTGAVMHEESGVDRHFEIFYDLLEYNITERLVPYRKLMKTSDDIDPPGSRCVPGTVLS